MVAGHFSLKTPSIARYSIACPRVAEFEKLDSGRFQAADFRTKVEKTGNNGGLTGERYVVKIVDDDIPPEVVEMEFEALEYAISAGFALQLPKIIQNILKNYETGIKIHINSLNRLILMSFIEGN